MFHLILITALGYGNFNIDVVAWFDTIEDCHSASMGIFWEDLPSNEEALCIRSDIGIAHDPIAPLD
jgi:hypothetical protein